MSNFSFYMLIIDLLMNIIGIALGTILSFKAQGNRLKLLWGLAVAICSISMLIDNLGWVERFTFNFGLDERSSLLIFDRMLKWYFFAHLISLYPIASLRPGWLTSLRITMLSLPLLFTSLVCICYIWFNGHTTAIYTIQEVFNNLDKTDIQVRVCYFFISIILPTVYFLIPFMGKWITLKRKLTFGMYLYILGSFVTLILYILFITSTTDTIFTFYAFIVTFLPNVFTIVYLFNESPLSSPRALQDITQQEENEYQQTTISPVIYKLNLKMKEFIEKETVFINPEYTILQLANDLNTNKRNITKTIQYSGYAGFNEYINYMRVDYFKKLAFSSPEKSIKELMFLCGFTSRSSFYRYFAEKEKMSPKEYIEKHLSSIDK